MKECDKRNSHISSKLHMIYISPKNDRHPVNKTFTPLHYNCRHFTSFHLNFTQLYYTTPSFGLTPFKFPTASFHLTSLHFTSLHFTSLHFTFRRFSPHFYSFHFTPFIIAFLTLFLKLLGLQGKVTDFLRVAGSSIF
jgi:hypothetical protein